MLSFPVTVNVPPFIARLLSGKLVENVRVGWLYNEVHFCFPEHVSGISDGCLERKAFRPHGMPGGTLH